MGDNGNVWFWQATWMTYPPSFCPLWIAKWANIPPIWAKWAISPPKGAKTGGMRNLFSIFIYKFWTFFVICPSPQNGGIVKDSKVSHDLWTEFAFVCLDFVDEAVIMEQYRNEVGLAAFKWCDVLDPEYRRSSWIAEEEWFTDMTNLIVDKWTSPCPW